MAYQSYYKRNMTTDRNLLNLQRDFKKAQDQYNTEYSSALNGFQTKMSAYQAQSKAYEDKFNAYKGRLDTYNAALDKYNTKTPLDWGVEQYSNGAYAIPAFYNAKYGDQAPLAAHNKLAALGVSFMSSSPYSTYFKVDDKQFAFDMQGINKNIPYGTLSKRGGPDPGNFTEQFTEAAPVAPAEVDTTAAKAKLSAASDRYSREVAEKKAGRLNARMNRSMLGGYSA